ncbi:MAG: RidA family protein [Bacteroidota bacterium]
MSKSYINPASGYTQVVTTQYNGLKTIYVSGQVGEGDSLAEQMTDALQNLKSQLSDAGADFSDIVKMNSYIVDYKPEDLKTFRETRKQIMGDTNMPASTLVGVSSLALPEWIIEIDAVAVIEAGL